MFFLLYANEAQMARMPNRHHNLVLALSVCLSPIRDNYKAEDGSIGTMDTSQGTAHTRLLRTRQSHWKGPESCVIHGDWFYAKPVMLWLVPEQKRGVPLCFVNCFIHVSHSSTSMVHVWTMTGLHVSLLAHCTGTPRSSIKCYDPDLFVLLCDSVKPLYSWPVNALYPDHPMTRTWRTAVALPVATPTMSQPPHHTDNTFEPVHALYFPLN